MKKPRVKNQAEHQPAASQSRTKSGQQSEVSVTLQNDAAVQTKRIDSLQQNPMQLAQSQKAEALQAMSRASILQEKSETTQRMEEDELQGKFDATQLMEDEELQGKFTTAQREPLEEELPDAGVMEEQEQEQEQEAVAPAEEAIPETDSPAVDVAEAEDLEEEVVGQAKIDAAQLQSGEKELTQGETGAGQTEEKEVEKSNDTGMPDNLKAGVENLSGMSLDGVQVHYNSDKPAQLNALAYAQGNDIHVGPGQEQHLPHEAWHLVQQAEGRVKPTMETSGGTKINDDASLEQEADVMGAKAAQFKSDNKRDKSTN